MGHKIAFVGGGNIAKSLVAGICNDGDITSDIHIVEPDESKASALREAYGATTSDDISTCGGYDVIILAVKPDLIQSISRELSELKLSEELLVISVAAGIRSSDMERWLGENTSIIRCMPNTPALYGYGANALYANEATSDTQKKFAQSLMSSVGLTIWIDDEQDMDAVTALSGSGPAYFFYMMEAMQDAGVSLGLDEKISKQLTIQTALGAAIMAKEAGGDLSQLRENVTSKGGTTEQALLSFENNGFARHVEDAMNAAFERSNELADEFGKDEG